MLYLQVLVNGIVLGGLYACIAVGFSLVWGVLNVINILHGTFIVIGSYAAYFAYIHLGIHPFLSVPIAAGILFLIAYSFQSGLINKVVAAPVLTTLTLTFGLELFVNNLLLVAFKADYRTVTLANPLGVLDLGGITIPMDRLAAMVLALVLTGLLFWVLGASRIGRAIVAVRMDREAAALMGVKVKQIYALTFGIGAVMAGAAGSLMSLIFPISPLNSIMFLGKAFVICILGGLGSVPGAMAGGLALGVLESFGALAFGPEHAITLSFILLILLLLFRPTGIMGKRGYE
ncbi:MAG: branched-chain amino acid ABC transporter permease [Pseudomonadota bacterium]